MIKWLSIPLAAIVVALVAEKRGGAKMSAYFKAGGRCMVKPYDDLPAYEIDCATWERERAAEQAGQLGYEVKS